MYAVSEAYLTAKNKIPQVHEFKLSGTIGGTAFTEANVLKGSLSINNKNCNGNDIVVGSVTVGTLKATFINVDVSEGDDIILSEGLKLANNTYEYIPMGVYRVSEANVTRSGTQVTAYDRMSFFDKDFTISTTYGTPYDIASLACTECGMELGMTAAEMQDLPNGTETLTLFTENDIETWRDLIFWLAQAMACFATVDRLGKLVFRPYRQTADDTIDAHKRYQGASFSRFVVRYSGISVVNKTDNTTSYYGLPDDQYLTYNLGANPFLQYGTDFDRDRIRRNVLAGIANIAYTPFTANVNVGALYDLGDIIQHEDGLAEDAELACVMLYTWKYNGGYAMEGVGKNPALTNSRSKLDKALQGILSTQKEDTIQYYLFTNAENINIADGEEKKIIDIRFASNKATVAVFHAEVSLESETSVVDGTYYDAVATVTYRYNDVNIDTYHPKETWVDGAHILHLLYYFEIQSALESRLEVMLSMAGGSVHIKAGDIRSSLYGQALAATDRWDGNIDIRQEVGRMELSEPTAAVMRELAETISCVTQTPIGFAITQEIGKLSMASPTAISMRGISEAISAETTEV